MPPDTEEQAPEQLSPEEATKDSEAVKTDDKRYVGVDPIYKQAAYDEPRETEPEGRSKAAKEAVAAEIEMVERVKANEAGCVVSVDEAQSFEDWVATSPALDRKVGVRGVDEDQMEANREATEEAKDETGHIPPSSGSFQQPGVNRV